MEIEDILNQEINLLKINIQDVINECKTKNCNNLDLLLIKKNTLIEQLNTATNKLKYENEVKKILRDADSLDYHRVKNKVNSIELISEIRKKRGDAKQRYEKMKIIELDYIENEIDEIPGFLFFNPEIIDVYGECPYIKISKNTFQDRRNWLKETYDEGELYRNLYEKIINKRDYNLLIKEKECLDNDINKIHIDILSKKDYDLLESIKKGIIEYNISKIKTKKVKQNFKELVNNLNNVAYDSKLDINDYLSEYYSINIILNLNTEKVESEERTERTERTEMISKIYKIKVERYKLINKEIVSSEKFISNTKLNLKQLLYEHLYTISNLKYVQVGKYFKRWSVLTNTEKLDRYKSFAEYFIYKYLIETKLVEYEDCKTTDLIINLQNILEEKSTKIKYKNIKWDVQKGVIFQISCLRYNVLNGEFTIMINEENKSPEIEKVKKKTIQRTILDNNTIKVINEDILYLIIYSKKNNQLNFENIKQLREKIIEKLKRKLDLKRISISDKLKINKTFDEIYNIIIENPVNL